MAISSSSFRPGQSGNPGGKKPDSPEVKAAKELARKNARKAVEVLIELMLSKACNEKTRILAANSVLDRGIGKPAQEQIDVDDSNRIATVADIDRALEQLRNGGYPA